MLLKDKIAVITGASRERGIGKATAKVFAEHGARVAILDLDESEAAKAAADIGPDHIGMRCDVTSLEDCKAAAKRVIDWSGRIDVLINNAGLTQRRKVMEVSAADYDLVTDVVLRGTLYMSQAVIPQMRSQKDGSIICISSLSALQGGGVFGGTHYCAAKAGVLGMTRSMAKELAPDGIRVNGVAPGLILTDFSRGENPDSNKHELAKSFPMGRVGMPKEVGGVCVFLASELSSYVTGTTIDVNGGLFIH
ncbi:SDR family NAD(P)-dependent oxidoreductase [Ferrovibrio xuzhouensis]|uniref:SDR family NAD(P)-dependent oxidoreductase n=1 Tax=Ferrovibrio xuzhouensis TaxID=1576914 RepID=A0ABV7VNZ1_9PROT